MVRAMASSRQREEERRLSVRTLAIASLASASAAIVTSYFWTGGTPIAAAVTPVIVALVSELLHRPTERIAGRFTRETTAILPDAAGAAPPPEPDADSLPGRAPAEPGSRPGGPQPPVRVYGRQAPRRRRIAIGVVAATAVLAFAIAAAALTLPELIAGESIGKSGRDTTLFGGRDRDRPEERERPETVPPAQEVEPPKTTPEEAEKQETEPPAQEPRQEEEPPPTETTPAPPELPQQ
jgi:hypothetical protein